MFEHEEAYFIDYDEDVDDVKGEVSEQKQSVYNDGLV